MREELFVKNARLRGRDALHGIHIREGKFYRVAPADELAPPEAEYLSSPKMYVLYLTPRWY